MTGKVGLYKEGIGSERQYRVRWFGQFDEATGKRKRYSRTFERKADAERFRDEKKAEFKQGTPRDPTNSSIKEYASQWLAGNKKIRPATVLLYKETLDRLYEYFGADCLIGHIDREAAKNFILSLKPRMKGKANLSGWTIHRTLRNCKTLFDRALDDKEIYFNPFKGKSVGESVPECIESEWYYLKPGEYLQLLDVTASLQEKVLYALCFTAGLRETEALTLRWADIDFEKGRIHVVNQKATETLPPFDIKDSDARTVPVPKHTLNLLTKLQVESLAGSPYVLITDDRFKRVCDKWQQCRETDKAWLPRYWANNIIRSFHRRVKQAGINPVGKKLTVHVLRKCCIQNWRNNLPENVVKAWGGHSNIETTDRFYSTVDEMHYEAAIKFGDNLLATDLKMTFSGVSEQNQKV